MAESGFSIAWEGLKGVYEALDRVSEQADEAARAIVTRGAAIAEKEMKAGFSGAHKKGEPHEGGDQPNVVTGTLRRSIRANPVARTGPGEYGTLVGPRTVYARRVELGYRGSHTVSEHHRTVKDATTGKKRKVKVREHTRTYGGDEGGGSKAYPYVHPGWGRAKSQIEQVQAEIAREFLKL